MTQNRSIVEVENAILDATCGSRTIWFDKENPLAIYCDKRKESLEGLWKGSTKKCIVDPDVIADFTDLPFADETFYLVVFDPPHLKNVGDNAWMYKKYGRLPENWQQVIKDGFKECMRVLKPYGTLVFKWSEIQISTRDVINAIGTDPLFGHRSGAKMNTHWLCFMKTPKEEQP